MYFIKSRSFKRITFTTDYLTKKKKINEGEIPQYYIENAHEPIVNPAVFEMVQQELEKRKTGTNRHSGMGIFASRLKCGECGTWYGAKVWHSNSKYRRTIFQCNGKFKNAKKCNTPHLYEEEIKNLYISAVNKLLTDKKEIISNLTAIRKEIFDTAPLETERAELQSELVVVTELIQKHINENARSAIDQITYLTSYNALAERFENIKNRLDAVITTISDKKARAALMTAFITELKKQEGLITEFDERLWYCLLEYATIYCEDDVRFTFKNGTEIKANP
jgi:hypothetical protein